MAVYVIFLQYNQQYDWPKRYRQTYCPIIFLFSFQYFCSDFLLCILCSNICISAWIFSYSFHRPKHIISSKHIDRKLVKFFDFFSFMSFPVSLGKAADFRYRTQATNLITHVSQFNKSDWFKVSNSKRSILIVCCYKLTTLLSTARNTEMAT